VDDPEARPTTPDDDQIQPPPEPLSKADVTEKKVIIAFQLCIMFFVVVIEVGLVYLCQLMMSS
jgi:hypothetical protein